MTSERFRIAACFTAVALTAGTYAFAQSHASRLAGTINDYSAAGGGWHITAEWSLHVKGASGKADFSAALTMVRNDLWVLLTSADPTDAELRGAHTHHVAIDDGQVTTLPNGVRVSGTATITSSGVLAGFSPSPVQIDITGGSAVPLSNIKLTFAGAAVGHFGGQPLDGVVVTAK